ncbi:hypothetical protein PLIIFM63780_010548 [Purpureocillium lilacinum]|nr:hypothetical protein PLIIFM63780_010548 [Purpureocillium lilacinum]
MVNKTVTLVSSVILALSSMTSAAPQRRDNGPASALSLTAQLQLVDTAVQRYSLLPNDKNFTYSFEHSEALFANRQTFPALVGTGGSMAIAEFPPCSIGFLHLHPRAAELFVVVSGHVHTEMVPEAGVVDASGKQRVIRTELGPKQMTFFPMGSFHTQVNPEFVGQTFALSDNIIESAFGQSIQGQDIDKGMVTKVESCLAKCGLKKRAL